MATNSDSFWVRPQAALANTTITLPPADQAGQRSIVPRVLCCLTNEHFDEDRFVRALQDAVAAAIAELPMLAGRVTWEDEQSSRIKIQFSDDPGVEVCINRMPHVDARQLDAAHWPPHSLPFLDLCLVQKGMNFLNNYIFAVKATIIKGGLILVLHTNHSVSDGTSNGHIQGLLVEHMARSLNGEVARPSGRFPPETQNRAELWAKQPARSIELWQDWQNVKNAIVPKPEPLVQSVWYISPEKLQDLRSTNSPVEPQTRLSTAHTLSTFLWRAVTRARRLPHNQLTTLLTPCQMRKITNLSPQYCGNCLTYGRAKFTVAQLLSQPLSESIAEVQRSCRWWTGDAVREMWGSIANVPNLADIKPNTNRDYGTDFEVSNLMHVPVHELDWGRGLEVRAFRWPGLALTDGWVNVLPRLPNGGLEVIVHATRTTLSNLLSDPQFNEYFHYRASSSREVDEEARTTGVALLPPASQL